ncbi:FimV/HubP family polar landmark protein [Crenobacter caeni]|uniref:FimV N-terminal domain-containing protein n=1 Tax=Crenobacter caeni TaxID=2705474 RepID=A0A6B2KSH6_9NEIS|nr:FimV/HubP family polar landmark protein [Crenobacter caeni]NDV13098.1 hypothetical protein [Crenobacter caeni]
MLFASTAWAGLGGIQVNSHLGESLRASIPLSGEDARTGDLSVRLASREAFGELGVDYAPALSSLRFSVVRQGGKAYVRVTSSQPLNEPFLRFVVEARTPSGRSLREYTVLLDPADYPLRQRVLEQDLPLAAPAQARAVPAAPRVMGGRIRVEPGQTLMSVARAVRPQGTSLAQTMDAIVAANPQAFAEGDPSRLLAGSVLRVPSDAAVRGGGVRAADTPTKPVERAPAKAAPAPQPKPAAAPAVAPAGKVPAEVVKLSVPEAASDPAARQLALEQEIARRDREMDETLAKIARLEAQLKSMQQGASAPAAAAPKPQAQQPFREVTPEPSMVDFLLEKLPLVGGGLAALLLALLGVRVARQRRAQKQLGATLGAGVGSLTQVDALGAGPLGTTALSGGNTFLTDFTRSNLGGLDAGEVDPVAEAEVYLAYGRDEQAEEILKDALAKDPTRHEARVKLLEIYAQRGNKGAFSQQAAELKAATDGRGPLWARAVALGQALDAGNPLYALADAEALFAAAPPSGPIDLDAELGVPAAAEAPPAPRAPAAPAAAADPLAALFAEPEAKAAPVAQEPVIAVEAAPAPEPAADKHTLDFDLDALFAEEKPAVPSAPVPPAAPAPADSNLLDFDFNLAAPVEVEAAPAPAPKAVLAEQGFDALFAAPEPVVAAPAPAEPEGFDALFAEPAPKAQAAPAAAAAADVDALFAAPAEDAVKAAPAAFDFDLDAEFGGGADDAKERALRDDPLSTKLDLARVYLDMGDKEGAREVLNELVGEAGGALRDEARQMLAKL